jgi:hypothetical protein
LAIPAAVAAIPVNPKSAATSAIIRKIKAQRSILSPPSKTNRINQPLRVFSQPNKSEEASEYVLFVHYEHTSITHSYSIVDWSVTCVAV